MTEIGTLPAVAMLAGAYLCGSVPFGLILTRLAGIGDIRSIGSGNIGATNVLRTGRRGIAALTLLLDCAKGAAPVVLVNILWPDQHELRAATALMAFLGHLYPVWLGFKGGKGVATTGGVVLGLSLPAAAIGGGLWVLLFLVLRYSSVAALVAVTVTPIAIWYFGDVPAVIAAAVIAIFVWIKHHSNIRRLIAGEEPKVRFSSST
jgi:glycerol-3-phosphate acyltransferase PlsY